MKIVAAWIIHDILCSMFAFIDWLQFLTIFFSLSKLYNFVIHENAVIIFLFYYAEEILRQLEASNSKVIIGTPNTFATIKEAVKNSKKDIKIVCIKTEADQTIPSGAIDFAALIDTNSKNIYDATER